MLTYIKGPTGKSLVARGIAGVLKSMDQIPFVFHEGATNKKIKAALKDHTDVIVCWQHGVPIPKNAIKPDINIVISRGNEEG